MIKKIIKALCFKFSIIKKNRIVFLSFEGHYSDSPQYISEAIHNIYPNIEIVWLVKKTYFNNIPEYVKKIEYDTIKAYYYLGSAHIIVDNVYGNKGTNLHGNKMIDKIKFKIITLFKYKKNQMVYTTWHGTPLKKMGRDQVNSNTKDFSCPNTTMILGNNYTLKIMKHLTYDKIKMKLLGTPRNDILLKNNVNEVNRIKDELKIDRSKKIILFAPSFRSDSNNEKNIQKSGINQINEIDFDRLFQTLNKKFGGEWIFICRFHYHVQNKIDWNYINERYIGKIINGNVIDDMSKYLLISDILISDVSSCMFDFMLTEKPVFIYFPDLLYYSNNERGLYLNINDLPFKYSEDFENLLFNIESFNNEEYISKLKKFIKDLEYVDNENSSNNIAKLIIDEGGLNE